MAFLHYPCGCKFQIVNPSYTEDIYAQDYLNQNIPIIYDIYDLPDCKKTWELFAEGNTRGVFQLEKGLGKSWSKKMKPEKLEDLSALVAILRPGCLNAFSGAPPKSIAQHYVDRKNRLEDIVCEVDAVKNILDTTYQMLIYQEQSIAITRDIAGFTESEADIMRRAIGKKKADVMSELEDKFIEGCKKVGKVTEEQAKLIFSWIKAGERYSFNLSHSLAYSYNTYITAYLKTHFPIQFYCAYIDGAREKQKPHEEIRELVLDAKNNNIMVCVPNLMDLTEHTYITGNDIYLGLSSIKGMGDKAILKLKDVLQNYGLPTKWIQFLIDIFPFITKTVTEGLIKSGALDKLKTPRTKMLFDIEICDKLTNKELEWLQINKETLSLTKITSLDKLIQVMLDGKAYKTPKRKLFLEDSLHTLQNPPYKLVDTIDFIYKSETELLAVPITCHKADYSTANVNCKDLNRMKDGNYLIAGEIKCNEYIIKRGKMAGESAMVLAVVDSSGQIDNVSVYPGILLKYKDLLYDNNLIMIQVNKWRDRLSAKKIIQI